LHRNKNELGKRKKLIETNYGTVVSYKANKLDAGAIFQGIQFSIPVVKDPLAYNQFAFRGKQNLNGSIFATYTVNNVSLFTEAAKSVNGGSGIIAGVLASLHQKLDMAMLYRKYDRDYYSFYANAFAENTTAQNESGMYWGWKYTFSRKYNFAAYADLFKFPWLKFRSYKPSHGSEFLLRFNYQPSKKITMFAQFRQETKEKNQSLDNPLYLTNVAIKKNLSVNFDYTMHSKFRMKTRGQFSSYDFSNNKTHGMALLQDAVFSIGRFQFSVRYALFDTEDFDNRQYVFENDVWLSYSLPAYSGEGIRNYVLVEYRIRKQITIWVRYASTRYTDRNETGSGMDAIKENQVDDVKMQLRFTL
jgi:hypothetical protein